MFETNMTINNNVASVLLTVRGICICDMCVFVVSMCVCMRMWCVCDVYVCVMMLYTNSILEEYFNTIE